jgi:hypothetical protein
MLKLMPNSGCHNCPKCNSNFNCHEHTVPVTIKFNAVQKWDNWGHMVVAFNTGDVVKGKAVVDGDKVYCATAQSPYWEVEDSIWLKNVEITLET